jgi:hypothetical protein
MPGFKQHFLDKYFGYRKLYVDYIAREAPARASLAVLSEIARLSFMLAGNAFCAAILGVLCAGAFARDGIALWPVVFLLIALLPACFALLTLRGLCAALGERGRFSGRARGARQ